MPYKIPWSNFHELNLDWLLEQVKQLREDVDNLTGSATPYTSTPEMDGAGTPGTSVTYSRGDHQHPTDTSRAAQADLAQEVINRGNADDTLQTNIDTVGAKIKFSAAAPLMDSSSASAGFSDFMARADHIHPTDTSRASATDVATLSARMDAFAGSANPSDTTPLMDGVGTAGTGGNYSRGDHVHPSDTSKVSKSGDTMNGDLRIDGALVPLHELKFMHVNSIGWIRIADVPNIPGTWAKFVIVRKGDVAASEVHTVELCINQTGINFTNENSIGNVLYVDHIRYSNAGKVDIHMDQTDTSDIGVRLVAVGPSENITNNIKLIDFQGVAPYPDGETLTDYKFARNTYGIIPLPTLAISGAEIDESATYRSGNVVHYQLSIHSTTSNTIAVTNGTLIATGFLPPKSNIITLGQYWFDTQSPLRCSLNTNGELVVLWDDGYIPQTGRSIIFEITYII